MLNNAFAISTDELIDRIYEAAVVPELWNVVLHQFALAAQSREGVLVATKGDQLKWIASSPSAEKFVAENYKYDGGMERTRRLLMKSRPSFVTDRDLFTEDEMINLQVYSNYLVPSGYGRGVATAIELADDSRIIIHAEGNHADGPYGLPVLQSLNRLRPHLARSAMISARLAFERSTTAVETLAALGYAACAVSREGKVLVANNQFDQGGARWTTRRGDKVALRDARGQVQLLAALSLTGSSDGVRSIALAPIDGAGPAVIHVVPVRRSALDIFNSSSAILVLTTAPSETTKSVSLLQTLFDLTPVEASVASRVTAGQSLQQIAIADGKSIETVRNQIKSVLAKTGCKRQLDLTRLFTCLIPPHVDNI